MEEDDLRAFRTHADWLILRNAQVCCLLMIAGCVVWWPLDLINFRRTHVDLRTLALMRLAGLGITGAVLLALVLLPVVRRAPRTSLALFTTLFAVCFGWGVARISGGDLTWFAFYSLAFVITSVLPLALRERLVASLPLLPAALAAFVLGSRGQAHFDLLPAVLSAMVFAEACCFVLGDVIYRLTRRSFLQLRALDRSVAAISTLNQDLANTNVEHTIALRILSHNLETARENERTRISRDLHDGLGQELSAIRYSLAFLRERFVRNPSSISPNLDDLDRLLGRTSAQLRQIVNFLRPLAVAEHGLAGAIERMVRRFEEHTRIVCSLSISDDHEAVDPDLAAAAFRVAQEAMTNVERHARAKSVKATLGIAGGAVTLVVEDDGVGIAASRAAAPSSGVGLTVLRERVDTFQGRAIVEDRPGGGTMIRVELPCRATAEAVPGLESGSAR